MTNARDKYMITSSGNMADGVADEERIARLRKRAEETEKMVSQLRQCVEVLKQKAGEVKLRLKYMRLNNYFFFLYSGVQQCTS